MQEDRSRDRAAPMEEADGTRRRAYTSPELEDFGSVAELTGVGQTNPGSDSLPGASGRDQGSVHPPGMSGGD
jgi:hypothetical protein